MYTFLHARKGRSCPGCTTPTGTVPVELPKRVSTRVSLLVISVQLREIEHTLEKAPLNPYIRTGVRIG
jgi:hypothetical protein